MSPDNFSQVARNAELGGSKSYHAQQHPIAFPLHIYRACFVPSKIKERDILLIYRACFVVHQWLKSERNDISLTYRLFRLIIA